MEVDDRDGFFFADGEGGFGVGFEGVGEGAVFFEGAAGDGGDEDGGRLDGAGFVDEAAEFVAVGGGGIGFAVGAFAGLVVVAELDEDVVGPGGEDFIPVAGGAEGAGGGAAFCEVGDFDGGFEEVGEGDAQPAWVLSVGWWATVESPARAMWRVSAARAGKRGRERARRSRSIL